MRILVSGACGFLGYHISSALIERGNTVIAVDDLSGGLNNVPISPRRQELWHFYKQDIGDYRAMEEIFMANRPEAIYHLASCAREGSSVYDPYRITRQNILISSILLELGIKYGMRKFCFTSSMATYGRSKVPYQEDVRRFPVDLYGESKLATEHMIEMLAAVHPFEWVVILPHNLFGIGQSLTDPYRNVVGITMQRLMRNEPLYLYGKGHVRAFSYIEDSLPCFIRAGEIGVASSQRINLGGKEQIEVRAMMEEAMKHFPEYNGPGIIELPPRVDEVEVAYSTSERSEKILGYKEGIGWTLGIARTAAWARTIGPKPWDRDFLALPSESMPLPWKSLHRPEPS